MSTASNDNDFYGSLAAAAEEESDSDAKAIQDMDDLEDDLFGSLLKKRRPANDSAKTKPSLTALEGSTAATEKTLRPRAGRRKASVIDDDDDLLDGLLPSDNESSPPPKPAPAKALPTETTTTATAAASSISFGSYVPSMSSAVPRTSRQVSRPEVGRLLMADEIGNGELKRNLPRHHDEPQSTPKHDIFQSSTMPSAREIPRIATTGKTSEADGLDRIPERERRSSLKGPSDLAPLSNQEVRNSTPDLDWLTGASSNNREGAGRRRAKPNELSFLEANPRQVGKQRTDDGVSQRNTEILHGDVSRSEGGLSLASRDVPQTLSGSAVGIARSVRMENTSQPFEQSFAERASSSVGKIGMTSVTETVQRATNPQISPAVNQELKLWEEKIITHASVLEGKMTKIEDECSHIQQLLTKASETYAGQSKNLSDTSRLESERLLDVGLDLEKRLMKIHVDWKKDLVSQEQEWEEKLTSSSRQLKSLQQEWKGQLEGLQSKVREDVEVIQRELGSFVGKLKPLQDIGKDERRGADVIGGDIITELAKLNVKLDRLVTQLEIDRQLSLESKRSPQEPSPLSPSHRQKSDHLAQQQEVQARQEALLAQMMEKIANLHESSSSSHLEEKIHHLEKVQEELNSAQSQLASQLHNSIMSANDSAGLASLQALKANEEQLVEWHNQLQEESQTIAAERIELAKQKQAVHEWLAEVERRSQEVQEMDLSANRSREAGLAALDQAKQLETSWQHRMASINDKLQTLQQKELSLLQRKQAGEFKSQRNLSARVESCERCEMLETQRVPQNWTLSSDPMLAYQFPVNGTDIDFHHPENIQPHPYQGLGDSKVLMWNLLAVQDRKLLQEEQSYLDSLSYSRTNSNL